MIKILFILLLIPTISHSAIGESCVYEIFTSSFSTVKFKEAKDEIKLKTKDFNQPIQISNTIDFSTMSVIVMADSAIEELPLIEASLLNGSIKKIGTYLIDKKGYIRNEDFKKIGLYIRNLRKQYEVEISTP